jgi:serine/threonine-protein kinase RsbW
METLTVTGILDSLGAIAKYVVSASEQAGLDKKSTYRLRLAVDEIASNIIIHGYEEAGLEGCVVVSAEIDDKTLKITLEDNCEPYDPNQKETPQNLKEPLETRNIGGLGVYLAFQGVDQFIYERVSDRNRNIFIVNRAI